LSTPDGSASALSPAGLAGVLRLVVHYIRLVIRRHWLVVHYIRLVIRRHWLVVHYIRNVALGCDVLTGDVAPGKVILAGAVFRPVVRVLPVASPATPPPLALFFVRQ
jgi:hypothetical protein